MNQPPSPSRRVPMLGCIADDVTGATDLAINLVLGGMRVVQVLGVPEPQSLTYDADAIVVALKTRSIDKQAAIQQSLESARALKTLGIDRFYFKYCSTFDSTIEGNIGPVSEALMEEFGVQQTIFCPAFPRAGRTVYRGHLFVGDTLLNESGMQNHPLNPMTDANLVRFLSRQTSRSVGLLSYDILDQGSASVRRQFESLSHDGQNLVITDTCDDAHLATLAETVASFRLITGGSGLARFMPQAYRDAGQLTSDGFEPTLPRVSGRSLIVAGSCSTATIAQTEWMEARIPAWPVDVPAVMADSARELARVKSWAATSDANQPLLVYSTAKPDSVADLQSRFGTENVASTIEQFLASVAKMLVNDFDVRKLVLAGGETSGAIVRGLGIKALDIGPEICAGVPWTQSTGQPRLALALKSGNFGAEGFFETALEMLT